MTVSEEHGVCCPNCGKDDMLTVEVTTAAKLSPDGAEVTGDLGWDGASFIQCDHCDHSGLLNTFRVEE